ncbi:hypothetical protein SBDP1_1580011 [Syntrophobacter sp. SbD1]|nr:hypothetical protein SBDP1_1580011 [Syntrophobacter sp. SbD1]
MLLSWLAVAEVIGECGLNACLASFGGCGLRVAGQKTNYEWRLTSFGRLLPSKSDIRNPI